MYPKAHPHGGGEGNSPIGMKYPKTYKGKPALGVKTRNKKKVSSKFIIKRRKSKWADHLKKDHILIRNY